MIVYTTDTAYFNIEKIDKELNELPSLDEWIMTESHQYESLLPECMKYSKYYSLCYESCKNAAIVKMNEKKEELEELLESFSNDLENINIKLERFGKA